MNVADPGETKNIAASASLSREVENGRIENGAKRCPVRSRVFIELLFPAAETDFARAGRAAAAGLAAMGARVGITGRDPARTEAAAAAIRALPVTLILISRYRDSRSFRSSFFADIPTPLSSRARCFGPVA